MKLRLMINNEKKEYYFNVNYLLKDFNFFGS